MAAIDDLHAVISALRAAESPATERRTITRDDRGAISGVVVRNEPRPDINGLLNRGKVALDELAAASGGVWNASAVVAIEELLDACLRVVDESTRPLVRASQDRFHGDLKAAGVRIVNG